MKKLHGKQRPPQRRTPPWAAARAVVKACVGLAVVWLSASCDSRADGYAAGTPVQAVGLTGSVALLDRGADRIAFISADTPLVGEGAAPGADLNVTFFSTRLGATEPQASANLDRLFLLSSGASTRLHETDERPALTVYSGGTTPEELAVIELDAAFDTITQDPVGRWVVLSSTSGIGVRNPNEFTLVDVGEESLSSEEPTLINKTIRSFGSTPKRFTFTPELDVPGGGPRRFLVVETDYDIALLDLENLDRPEVTIPVPQSETTGSASTLAGVVAHAGEPEVDFDGRLAVRFTDSKSVLIVGFANAADRPYEVTLNLVNLSGPATDADFVTTDGGLRLAALVPSTRQAVLVNLNSTVTTPVSLPGALSQMKVVTEDALDDGVKGDIALLWSQSANIGIAFWSLGETSDRAFRSVEGTNLNVAIRRVVDIPGAELGHRKLLETASNQFYVLDLETRTTFLMTSDAQSLDLKVSRNGKSAWASALFNNWFSRIDLETLHPETISVERGVTGVWDIETKDGQDALLAVHHDFGGSVTAFDANAPDSVQTRHYAGLLLREFAPEDQ